LDLNKLRKQVARRHRSALRLASLSILPGSFIQVVNDQKENFCLGLLSSEHINFYKGSVMVKAMQRGLRK